MDTKTPVPAPQPEPPRILARQLARPLTDEEIDLVAGGLAPRTDTNCETGCTNDCGT
jgi:hypothetical protein